jgi:hypothetical protein
MDNRLMLIYKDLEASGRGLFEILLEFSLEGLNKTKRYLSGNPISWPRFEMSTSQYESTALSALPTRSVNIDYT